MLISHIMHACARPSCAFMPSNPNRMAGSAYPSLRYMKKEDAGITVDSEIIEQVSTEFFTQWWSLVASSSWLISGQLTR